jgi:cell division transport system permease protein
MFSRIGYTVKQTFSQIGRNKGMSFTAVLAITAMMLILGLFFTAFVNVDLFANVIKQDYNVLEVYLDDGDSSSQIKSIGEKLSSMKGVEKTTYRTKEEALKIMKKRWGENGYLLDNLGDNPLPNSYLVYVKDKSAADRVSENAAAIDGVEDVKYYQDTVRKLQKITNFIQVASVVTMTFLIIVSIIIVANTIKLTVFNREKEIGIMKYLGATDWFVRGPFLLEGIFIGIVSALIATGLVYVIYQKVIDVVGTDIMRMLSVPVVSANYLITNLLIIFLALGVGVGTCGSIISIRRFLDR